jgi:hypothetical protein
MDLPQLFLAAQSFDTLVLVGGDDSEPGKAKCALVRGGNKRGDRIRAAMTDAERGEMRDHGARLLEVVERVVARLPALSGLEDQKVNKAR